MLNKISLFLLAFGLAIGTTACNDGASHESENHNSSTQNQPVPVAKHPLQESYESLGWLSGSWKGVTEGESLPNTGFFEYWKNDVDGVRAGWSYRLSNGDTLGWTDLRIEYSSKGLFYKQKPAGENAIERSFKMSSSTPQFIEFESQDGGFPQFIKYIRGQNNQMMVSIKGTDGEGNSANLESIYNKQ